MLEALEVALDNWRGSPMNGLLNSLENEEAILLMYLADELPPGDRAEVARMLSEDAHLRDQLDALRAMQSQIDVAMDRLDASSHLSSEAVLQRLLPAMRRRQVELANGSGAGVLKWPRWAYPAALAAAAAIVLMGLWGLGVFNKSPERPVEVATASPVEAERWLSALDRSFDRHTPRLDEADYALDALRDMDAEAVSLQW